MICELDLEKLEAVMKLMEKYKIADLEVEGIKLSKKIHMGPKLPKKRPITILANDEDIMFASSSAPKLTLQDFNRFAANPIKDS